MKWPILVAIAVLATWTRVLAVSLACAVRELYALHVVSVAAR